MTYEEIVEVAEQVYGKCQWSEAALNHLETFAKLVAEKTINDTQMATKYIKQHANDIRETITPQEAIAFLVFIGWTRNKIAKYCGTDHSVICRISTGHTQSCNYILADSLRGLVDKIKTHHNIKETYEEV